MKLSDYIVVEETFNYGRKYVTPDVVVVPDQYVDGVHTRNVMSKKDFPIKIQVLSTGHILNVYGYKGDLMIYTSEYKLSGTPIASNGTYRGKLGKDFLYI